MTRYNGFAEQGSEHGSLTQAGDDVVHSQKRPAGWYHV